MMENCLKTALFTKTGLQVSTGFLRIVKGKRGVYLEIEKSQVIKENLIIPKSEEWRLNDSKAYYIEYRTKDLEYVKLYLQKRKVKYADYKVGMWYVYWKDVNIWIGEEMEELQSKLFDERHKKLQENFRTKDLMELLFGKKKNGVY